MNLRGHILRICIGYKRNYFKSVVRHQESLNALLSALNIRLDLVIGLNGQGSSLFWVRFKSMLFVFFRNHNSQFKTNCQPRKSYSVLQSLKICFANNLQFEDIENECQTFKYKLKYMHFVAK